MIYDIIKPIKLALGDSPDTAETGQGCFMNIVAFLNGDPVITDYSPCVCRSLRSIFTSTNDFLALSSETDLLLPFVERALGSATTDTDVIYCRLMLVRNTMRNIGHGFIRQLDALIAELSDDPEPPNSIIQEMRSIWTATLNDMQMIDELIDHFWHTGDLSFVASDCAIRANAILSRIERTTEYAHIDRIPVRDALLKLFDDALPPASTPKPEVVERALRLRELAQEHGA